jgi:hypothetical protein
MDLLDSRVEDRLQGGFIAGRFTFEIVVIEVERGPGCLAGEQIGTGRVDDASVVADVGDA